MRRLQRFGLGAALGVAVGLAMLATAPGRLAFDSIVISPQAGSVECVNVLGNGTDDVALGLNGDFQFARIQGRHSNAFGARRFPSPITVQGTADLDGDGLDEVGVAMRDTTRGVMLYLLDRAGGTVDSLGLFTGPSYQGRPWNGAAFPAGAIDRADGSRLLCAVVLGERHAPRAILGFDLARRRVEWEFPFGAFPAQAEWLPGVGAPGDSSGPLLIVGTSATDNPGTGPPLDDSLSYLIALDPTGANPWTLRTGGVYSCPQFVAFTRQAGRARDPSLFVAMHEHAGENPQPARLLVVDGRNGRILRERGFPTSFGMPRRLSETPPRFVVGDADGGLAVYDDSLRRLASRQGPVAIEAWACDDLDGDGQKEVIASTEHECLVLDERLRVLGRFPLEGQPRSPVRILLRRNGVSERSLVSVDNSVLDWRPRRVSPAREPRRWALVGLAGLLVGALASLPPPRRTRRSEPARVREFLVEHMQIHHEVFDTKGPVEALRRWVQQVHAGLPVADDPRESARDHLQLIGVPALHRFISRAAALRVDEARLAAATRQVGALEQSVSGRALSPDDAARVVQALNDLQGACAALYREVGERMGARPDVAAQDALRARQRELVDAGVESSCTCAPRAAVLVVFDPDELREIVGQLLENAARQLARREGAAVRVDVTRDGSDPRWITIEVADNGPGVPAELRERIFEATWSTRRKGGFGLAHARDLARAWRGSLMLAEGQPGACFQLRVRVLDPFGSGGA